MSCQCSISCFSIVYQRLRKSEAGTDLGSAGPCRPSYFLGPNAGATYLAVCLKSVKECPSYVLCPLKNLYFVVPGLVLQLP